MYIQNKPRWQIKENQVTNEQLYLNRRKFIKNSFSILGSTALLHNLLGKDLNATQKNEYFLKFKINKKYHILSDITPENLSTKYNNFFSFSYFAFIITKSLTIFEFKFCLKSRW